LVSQIDFDEFANHANLDLDQIRKDLEELSAKPTIINYSYVITPGTNRGDIPSSSSEPNPTPALTDKYGYLKNIQKLELNEQFMASANGTTNVPWGNVKFDASKENPWSLEVLKRKYSNVTVIGKDENGRSYAYVKFMVDVNGKSYPVMINTSRMVQEYPSSRFQFWNPRLFVGASAGVDINQVRGELPVGASLGIMSYGQYKTSPDWSFLHVGGGYGTVSQRPMLMITPAAYNVGKHIPFMSNTYISTDLGMNTNGDLSVSGGIKVGL
jgi:hypothetical protein